MGDCWSLVTTRHVRLLWIVKMWIRQHETLNVSGVDLLRQLRSGHQWLANRNFKARSVGRTACFRVQYQTPRHLVTDVAIISASWPLRRPVTWHDRRNRWRMAPSAVSAIAAADAWQYSLPQTIRPSPYFPRLLPQGRHEPRPPVSCCSSRRRFSISWVCLITDIIATYSLYICIHHVAMTTLCSRCNRIP